MYCSCVPLLLLRSIDKCTDVVCIVNPGSFMVPRLTCNEQLTLKAYALLYALYRRLCALTALCFEIFGELRELSKPSAWHMCCGDLTTVHEKLQVVIRQSRVHAFARKQAPDLFPHQPGQKRAGSLQMLYGYHRRRTARLASGGSRKSVPKAEGCNGPAWPISPTVWLDAFGPHDCSAHEASAAIQEPKQCRLQL